MIRGADKWIKDANEKTPKDIARDQKFANIDMLLEDETCLEKVMKNGIIKSKAEKSRAWLYTLITILLTIELSNIYFIFPCKFDFLFTKARCRIERHNLYPINRFHNYNNFIFDNLAERSRIYKKTTIIISLISFI